jgi:CubicO group peptidase (beta-lactamase class C family)
MPAAASAVPPIGSWPLGEAEDLGMDPAKVRRLLEFASAHKSDPYRGDAPVAAKSRLLRDVLGPDADVHVDGPFTTPGALNGLVIRRGHVVGQIGDTSYVDEIASATKSFLSLLAGVAFDRGIITDVHRSVFDDIGLELLSEEHNRRITWHHLLQQTSEWEGELFGRVPSGHRGERIGEPLHDPGTYWEYNDVRVNVLARCLLEIFGGSLPDVLRDEIMRPIGASNSWSWHGYDSSWTVVKAQRVQSVSGGSHWGGGIWMNAQDLARVGLLYLRGGVWGDQRLLSRRWIDMTRHSCDLNPMYGYMWWLQHNAARKQVSFAAQGGGSHQLFVIPDHDVVVVMRWIADDAWPGLLDRALGLTTNEPDIGPVRYLFDEINRPTPG